MISPPAKEYIEGLVKDDNAVYASGLAKHMEQRTLFPKVCLRRPPSPPFMHEPVTCHHFALVRRAPPAFQIDGGLAEDRPTRFVVAESQCTHSPMMEIFTSALGYIFVFNGTCPERGGLCKLSYQAPDRRPASTAAPPPTRPYRQETSPREERSTAGEVKSYASRSQLCVRRFRSNPSPRAPTQGTPSALRAHVCVCV